MSYTDERNGSSQTKINNKPLPPIKTQAQNPSNQYKPITIPMRSKSPVTTANPHRVSSAAKLSDIIRKGLPDSLINESQFHGPSASKRGSICMVHNSLNLNLDNMTLEDEIEDDHVPDSAPSGYLYSPVTPREPLVQILSKDAISEMVVSVRDLSNNLSK